MTKWQNGQRKNEIDINSNKFQKVKMHTSLRCIYKINKKKEKRKRNPLQKVLIKLQNKAYFFNLIWSLEVWLAGLSTSEVVPPFLSLATPSAGMTVEAKSCWKPWEATSASGVAAALSKDASLGALVSLAGSCWLGGGGFWDWTSWLGSIVV